MKTRVHPLVPLFLAGAAAVLPSCATPVKDAAQEPPVAKDRYLGRLVGEWTIERSIRGKVVGNTLTVTPVLDGAFVQMHMKSTSAADPYEAIVTAGFDAGRGEYVVYWCDSFGPGYSSPGRGKRSGESLELTFPYPDGPFYNTWVYDTAQDFWTFTGETGTADGGRKLFARDKVTRRSR